ncbi:MAG: 16S rRNA (guanine(527)-N(7))-methyltransferase RsmG [Thermodesulfobacteriota bacterium]
MAELLRRSGIVLTSGQLEQLWIYHTLIRRHNAELNLTRIHNFSNMVLKLYADSILPGRLMRLPDSLLDLGTGPGMPGIPLKIVNPQLKIILAESRGKRVDFLKMAVERLKLDNVTVVGRSITADFETPVRGVITRAVEEIGVTLGRISGCLSSGGLAIFMKGPECDAEVAEAVEQFPSRFRLSQNIDYQIPHTPHARRLIVFERTDEPVRERRSTAMNRHVFRRVESDQNSFFKELKRLQSGRGIKKEGLALISGSKQVKETLRDFPGQCRAWISAEHHLPPPADLPAPVVWYQLAGALFKEIDTIGTDAPLLMVTTPPVRRWEPSEGLPAGCSLLVPFQDPENVGAVIRSAMAFGVDHIILLSESAHPYHPRALRASGGAVLKADLMEGPALKDIPGDLPVIALSAEGEDISTVTFPRTFAFLPGMEGQGLPLHFRKRAVAIPIDKAVESLNAATAVAIAFYAWKQKRG